MWWYGRGNSGGSWLPEEKKANVWHGRGNSGGSWPPAFPRSSDTWIFNSFLIRRLLGIPLTIGPAILSMKGDLKLRLQSL